MHNLYLLIYKGQHVDDGEAVVLSFLKRLAVDCGPQHVEQMVRALIPMHGWNRSSYTKYIYIPICGSRLPQLDIATNMCILQEIRLGVFAKMLKLGIVVHCHEALFIGRAGSKRIAADKILVTCNAPNSET